MEKRKYYCGHYYPSTEKWRFFDYSKSTRKIGHTYCDTHNLISFGCDNFVLDCPQTSKIGLIQYRCLGHDSETFSSNEREKWKNRK